ncbi:putative transposon, En/Spm-like protein [Tanacetum coccineum]
MTSTSDRAWMYKMTDTQGYSNQTYVQNVELFLDFAYSNHEVVEHMSTRSGEIELRIKCPCKGVNGSAGENGSENGSTGVNGSVGSVASTSIGVGELNEVGESSGGQAVKPRWVNDKSRDHMEKYQESMVESHGENVESHPHNEELWNKITPTNRGDTFGAYNASDPACKKPLACYSMANVEDKDLPLLQKLYMNKKMAKDMVWHHTHKTKQGSMAHPSDGKAWKHFDSINLDFAEEIRNVETVIRRVEDISDGRIETYDAYRRENFTLRAILLWTISDLPAYAMLSGWSTHGALACPCCMGDTKSFRLTSGGKPCWFDCHRRFLPPKHAFRRDKKGFKANSTVASSIGPPLELTSHELYQQVYDIPTVYKGVLYDPKAPKPPGFGKTHNWVKKSIFWELPYWRLLLIQHNLDVMHIEKNVLIYLFFVIDYHVKWTKT